MPYQFFYPFVSLEMHPLMQRAEDKDLKIALAATSRHWTYSFTFTWFVHYDVIKWKHFPHYRPLLRGIHRSPVNSSHKGQWRGALVFSLICAWINGWVNNCEASYLRRHRAHYDVTAMVYGCFNVTIDLSLWYQMQQDDPRLFLNCCPFINWDYPPSL